MYDQKAIAEALKTLALDPGFDAESVVRFIYDQEGFNAEETPDMQDQIRDLLSADGHNNAKINALLGYTVVNIPKVGGRRRATNRRRKTRRTSRKNRRT